MKILVTLTVAIAALCGHANASECEYRTNELDPFTQQKLATTRWSPLKSTLSSIVNQTIGNNSEIYVSAIRVGEQKYLAVQLKLSDTTMHKPTNRDIT